MFSIRGLRSLRGKLLAYLLLPLIALLAVNTMLNYRQAVAFANKAYDRTLLGAALTIAERVEVDNGAIVAPVPYAAFEMLESNHHDRVFYRVSHPKQGEVTGYADLPLPPYRPQREHPIYYDSQYHGEAVRIVALRRPLYTIGFEEDALVLMGETITARSELAQEILASSLLKESLLIVAAALVVWLGISRAVQPLLRIRDTVRRRDRTDLTPLPAEGVPREVMPLVDAINEHTTRLDRLLATQRQFIADASHQLKTPLAVLRAQADLALRQEDAPTMRRILGEMREATDSTAHLVRQLLALARTETDTPLPQQTLDLAQLARDTTFEWLPSALAKGVDLGYEGPSTPGEATMMGEPTLLHELLANLIDNALRYTPAGRAVTVRLLPAPGMLSLEVDDQGPGIPSALREKVFERFFRLPGDSTEGCGLGLSIVEQIAAIHGASVRLNASDSGGLRVHIAFPLPTAKA